jgi:hypothetical protein
MCNAHFKYKKSNKIFDFIYGYFFCKIVLTEEIKSSRFLNNFEIN